ncbi:MAG: permease-like cell division protein FtsX [Coriobacteriia bacterium]|nr:permease-like cell division protein FtsX [Coriobacteriia bacterium]
MSSFVYFLREALTGFRRNISTAIGSIVTIFLSLLIIGLFLVGTVIVNNIVNQVESEVAITVYVADTADKGDIDKLMDKVKSNPKVKSVGFTTKDQALVKFKDSMSSSPEIINQLDGQNPLPASVDIELIDAHDVNEVAKTIENDDIFKKICDNPQDPMDSLKYGQKTVDKLFAVTNAIRVVGFILVALLIFIAMIFINNTIRLSILARRKEIAIMRLVGASNGFIRGPFFMESCLHSFIGAVASIIILGLIRNFALPAMINNMPWLPLNLDFVTFLIIYLVLLVAAVVIGIIGSALAMRRYLTV